MRKYFPYKKSKINKNSFLYFMVEWFQEVYEISGETWENAD